MTSLSEEVRQFGQQMTKNFEGIFLLPHTDKKGDIKIGWGRNLSKNGTSREECQLFFVNDYTRSEIELSKYIHCWNEINDTRKIVLIDIHFDVGMHKFTKFNKMITAIYQNDFIAAANEIRNSEIRPDRAETLAHWMEKGTL